MSKGTKKAMELLHYSNMNGCMNSAIAILEQMQTIHGEWMTAEEVNDVMAVIGTLKQVQNGLGRSYQSAFNDVRKCMMDALDREVTE